MTRLKAYIAGMKFFVFVQSTPIVNLLCYFICGFIDGAQTHINKVKQKISFENEKI